MAMTQRSARDLVAHITGATEEGDYEAAVHAAAWGIESFPDAAVFHRLRGAALMALAANDEAKADLTQSLAVDPLDHEALVTLSRLEEAEGDLYTAAEHLLTAWEHDPANGLLRSDLTYRLARLYGSEGYLQYTRPALAALYVRNSYPERAAREYAAALAEQPTRVDLRLASVLARWRLGALTEAADGCVLLLEEQPQLVRARWALADALARRGKGEEAREHAKHAALLDPDGAIARALIEGNPEATIVDPDETVRVPLDTARSGSRVTVLNPNEMPAPVPPMPPSYTPPFNPPMPETNVPDAHPSASDMPFAANGATTEPVPLHAFTDDRFGATETETLEEPIGAPPQEELPPMPQATMEDTVVPEREDVAAMAAPPASEAYVPPGTDTIVHPPPQEPPPEDVPVAAVPPEPEEEPEVVTVVAAAHDELVMTHPGGEPLLDPTDVLPESPESPESPDTGSEAVGAPEAALEPDAAEAHPSPDSAVDTVTEMAEPAPMIPEPPAPPVATAPEPEPTTAPAAPTSPEALTAAMRARVAADDVPGALALGKAALMAAGKDPAQVRPLLPAMRALVEAAPNRPDTRRLLGDTYRRLGQTAQAQGQYQQALLVRVAGKR